MRGLDRANQVDFVCENRGFGATIFSQATIPEPPRRNGIGVIA
jgi:hypothetical protein